MAINMTESFRSEKSMGLVASHGLTDPVIREALKMGTWKEKASINGRISIAIREIERRMKCQGKVCLTMATDVSTKGHFTKMKNTGRVQ